jgi:histone-lysine N-methyltransferase MLL3
LVYIHLGLKLIEEEDSEKEEETRWMKRSSPIIPIVSPIPIRLRPGMQIAKEMSEVVRENIYLKQRRLYGS